MGARCVRSMRANRAGSFLPMRTMRIHMDSSSHGGGVEGAMGFGASNTVCSSSQARSARSARNATPVDGRPTTDR